jgi:hypothetical protein
MSTNVIIFAVRLLLAPTLIGLVSLAGILGPHLSGLLAPFLLFATILAVFTHRFHGALAHAVFYEV